MFDAQSLSAVFKRKKGTANYFTRLGETILREWSKSDYSADEFSALATAQLARLKPTDHISYGPTLRWALSSPSLSQQADVDAEFGEPPLTVFFHPRFRIDLMFWNTSTPSILQHGWSGAFAILYGASVQARFTFRTDERVNERLRLGCLTMNGIRVMVTGDIEPIDSGPKLIHAVYHLNSPTLSLVIRTHSEPWTWPQWGYFMPSLAKDPFHSDPVEKRRLQLLRLVLDTTERCHGKTWLQEAVRHSTVAEAFEILTLGASRWGLNSRDYEDVLADVHDRHPRRAQYLGAAVAQRVRVEAIHSLRRTVREPRYRLLLAAALYSQDADTTARLLQGGDTARQPRECLSEAIQELVDRSVLRVEREALCTRVWIADDALSRVELLTINAEEPGATLMTA